MFALFPEIARNCNKENVDFLSTIIHKYFGNKLLEPKPTNPSEIIENFGIELTKKKLGYPGAIVFRDDKGCYKPNMFIDSCLPAFDENFLKCYLLGRFLLEAVPIIIKGQKKSWGFKEIELPLKKYEQGPSLTSSLENSSLLFSGSLLLPKKALTSVTQKIKKLDDIAKHFHVTVECLEQRCLQLTQGGATKNTQNNKTNPQTNRLPSNKIRQYSEGKRPKSDLAHPASPATAQNPLLFLNNRLKQVREIAKKIDKGVE